MALGKSSRRTVENADVRHRLKVNYPFFLFHQDGWEEASVGLDEPMILPRLKPLEQRPGCNLMRTRQKGEDPSAVWLSAVRAHEDGGKVVFSGDRNRLSPFDELPDDCVPEGLEGSGYQREILATDPRSGIKGSHYHEVWNVASETPKGVRFDYDHASHNRFRLWLVTAGHIEAPEEWVKTDLLKALNRRAERRDGTAYTSDRVKGRLVDAADARLGKAKAAVLPQKLELPAPPKPKRPKRTPART
jgi:hypothetical protein